MNLEYDYPSILAQFIIEQNHILTDEIVQLSLLYRAIEEYFSDVNELMNFYEQKKEFANNLKYEDLGFYRDLLNNNYDKFIVIIKQMKSAKSIEEIQINLNNMSLFINHAFADTCIRVNLLEYLADVRACLEDIKTRQVALIKFKILGTKNEIK